MKEIENWYADKISKSVEEFDEFDRLIVRVIKQWSEEQYKEFLTGNSIVDNTFKEMDERLSILNKETIDWLKKKILNHVTEAYNRGKNQTDNERKD